MDHILYAANNIHYIHIYVHNSPPAVPKHNFLLVAITLKINE